jgi:hypothetical protein
MMFGSFSAKRVSLAGVGGAEAIPSRRFRSVGLLPRTGKHLTDSKTRASLPSRRTTDEDRDPLLLGEVLEISALLSAEHTEIAIPLHGLRVGFCGDPVASPELPGGQLPLSRDLSKVSDPWFISVDGRQDVLVEAGAWSLEPVLRGRLANGAGVGKHVLWFWVDLKVPVAKSGFEIPEGARLFFAINVLEKAELPNLLAGIQELEAKIASFKDMGREHAKSFGSWITYVKGYDEHVIYEAQLSTLALGVPSSRDKLTEFGRFCVRENKTGVVYLSHGKKFGQVGSFRIKPGRDSSQTMSLTTDGISI